MIVTADGGLSFEDGPDRARIIVSGEDTGGCYSLMEWTVAPSDQTGFGAHRHGACEETFLIRGGRLEFLLGDTVATLGPGDFVRAPPGVRHGYRNSSGAPVEMLVGFVPAGMEMLFVKYRTDGAGPEPGEGFIADATRLFGSEFEA
jgi:mannose-6-phosphate isomerase-like protein (cupin superfamily)